MCSLRFMLVWETTVTQSCWSLKMTKTGHRLFLVTLHTPSCLAFFSLNLSLSLSPSAAFICWTLRVFDSWCRYDCSSLIGHIRSWSLLDTFERKKLKLYQVKCSILELLLGRHSTRPLLCLSWHLAFSQSLLHFVGPSQFGEACQGHEPHEIEFGQQSFR